MQVTVEQQNPCKIALKIEVEPEVVAKAINETYKEFSQTTRIPGFRKGKAPRKILEKYISQESLKRRAIETLVPPVYREAVIEQKIQPYADPDFDDLGELEEGKPFSFTALVPLPPKIELGDYKGIEVKRQKVKVTDEEVDAQIKYLLESRATSEKVEDRGVQTGDIVIAEIASTIEGGEKEGPKRSLVEAGKNIPGFDEQIEGMKPGDRRTFSLKYPEDFSEEELAGKNVEFDIAVETIRARIIPELTDEFAKTIGNFESVAAMREDAKANMTKSAEENADREVEGKIIDEIVKRSEVCFPDILVEHDVHHDIEDLQERLQKQGITPEQYLEQMGKTEDEYLAELRESAATRIRMGLVLGEIAEKENIDVTDEEVEAEIDRIAIESKAEREAVETYIEARSGKAHLKNSLFNKKIMDLIKSVSKIK